MLTCSFCATSSATFPSFSLFVLLTFPNCLIRSPNLSPASSAGLPAETALTLANSELAALAFSKELDALENPDELGGIPFGAPLAKCA